MSTAEQETAAVPAQEPTAVVVRDQSKRAPAITNWDADFQRLVKLTLLKPKNREATGAELAMFAEQVQRTGLDPFFKQIYGIFRYDSRAGGEVMQVQAGIDGFRLIAERTGKYEGQTPQQWCGLDGVWKEIWIGDGPPTAARVGVYKKGRREPTYAVAHWREYVQTNRDGKPSGKWADMGANQLSKCSEALALRKAFPAELSGLYTPEEMEQAANTPSLAEGRGDGQPVGLTLGPAVEAVIARATALGHSSLSESARGTIEIQLGGQPPAMVAQWVRNAHDELDEIPVDAEVVEPQEGDVSAAAPQTPEPEAEAQDAPQAPAVAPEASESAPDPERIEAMRRRAGQLLDDADGHDARGDERAAADARAEADSYMAQVEAASNVDQGSLL